MKPSSIKIPLQHDNIDMTESSSNDTVVPPLTDANNQEIISPEQTCDDYKDQIIQESMVCNNYDFDDFNDFDIAQYKEEDEDAIDIHDSDNYNKLKDQSKGESS